ncbi:MAG TPA: antitoxin [Thermoanaerobaculia bacterium]|nr:antitoxin [Thermoanaerobaculia bacterium]
MIRTQISFDADLYTRARATAARHGISMAELCRRAVAEVIARESPTRPWMSFAGIFDGSENDSESVDTVVYDRETL